MADFQNDHPGGRFFLEHNIGGDVSKFYYGGYSQVPSSAMAPYRHSNVARDIVSSLVVGYLHEKAMTFSGWVSTASKHLGNRSLKVFTISTKDKIIPLSKATDVGQIGKHHLIRNETRQDVSRHYTITNCLKEEAY